MFRFGKINKAQAVEKAEVKKREGNELFAQKNFVSAIERYSDSIKLIEESHLESNVDKSGATWVTPELQKTNLHQYYSNRAICNIKIENYGSAICDANMAIELHPEFFKAYYRRGCAYLCLLKFQDAQAGTPQQSADFLKVLSLCNDPNARMKLKECKKIIREQKFSEAITRVFSPELLASPHDKSRFFSEVLEYLKVRAAQVQVPGNVFHRKYVCMVILELIKIVKEYESIVDITVGPTEELTVCGDIHGQFYDLLNIFKLNGPPSDSNPYLFNGDFVDRGSFSFECAITLFLAKLLFPANFHIVRGNHETESLNRCYGFRGEVLSKYDEKVYTLFCESFRYLPLGYLINKKVLVVHGGLFGAQDVTIDDLKKINRFREPGDSGLMTDILWSDPKPSNGLAPSKRGVAYEFGPDITRAFLAKNDLAYIIRSHEVKQEGYEVEHDGKMVTIFSAPNYCDQMGNKGAFIRVKGNTLEPKFTQFEAVEHPPMRAMHYANPLFSGIY